MGMDEPTLVGVQPWLPAPLAARPWWTEPVRAERLSALRIGIALVLLLDIALNYLPHVADLYGADGLGAWEVFAARNAWPRWSLLRTDDPAELRWYVIAWAAAGLGLLLGFFSRLSALLAWALAVSFLNRNPYIHNAGDTVRVIILFYLMLTPCGAVWSLDAWLRRQRQEAVFIAPWALRLLFVQLVLIYFFNGVFKLAGRGWQEGDVLHYVLVDVSLARLPFAQWPLPEALLSVTTWLVLLWEIGFPLLVMMPATRKVALVFGVLLHIGIGLSVEIAMFSPCMICMYLPLLPWERLTADPRSRLSAAV